MHRLTLYHYMTNHTVLKLQPTLSDVNFTDLSLLSLNHFNHCFIFRFLPSYFIDVIAH